MKQDPEGVTVRKILDVPGVREGDVLEIGCGDGRITGGLLPWVKRLVAVDPDETSIRKAKSELPEVEFQIGSAEQLGFANHSFHTTIFTLSLHHQPPRRALAEATRVARDDGTVLVLEPVAGSEVERLCRPLNDERHALLSALYAVLEGPLKIWHKEIFQVRWFFQDQQELIRWVFWYYGRPFDEQTARRIMAPVMEKSKNRPLVIEDRMLLVALRWHIC